MMSQMANSLAMNERVMAELAEERAARKAEIAAHEKVSGTLDMVLKELEESRQNERETRAKLELLSAKALAKPLTISDTPKTPTITEQHTPSTSSTISNEMPANPVGSFLEPLTSVISLPTQTNNVTMGWENNCKTYLTNSTATMSAPHTFPPVSLWKSPLSAPMQSSECHNFLAPQPTFPAFCPKTPTFSSSMPISQTQPMMSFVPPNTMFAHVAGSMSTSSAPSVSAPPIASSASTNIYNARNEQFIQPYFGRRHLMELPEFSGRAEEWPMFIAEFRQSTLMYGYDNIENTNRLRKCLRGEAKQTVESLLILPHNVEQMIYTLQQMFGRPECLVRSQLAKARALKPIAEHELYQLIPFATTIQSLVAFLNTEQTWQQLSNPVLFEEIVQKLPPSKRMEWAREASTIQNPTMHHLSQWLTNLGYFAGIATAGFQPATNTQRSTRFEQRSSKSSSVLQVEVQTQRKCSQCQSTTHTKLADCESFRHLSVDERWKTVTSKKICISCLNGIHNKRYCRYKRVCPFGDCRMQHHKLLHKNSERATTNVTTNTTNNSNDENGAISINFQRSIAVKTLFRTVPIKLFGRGSTVDTFALLDEGSALTIIDEDLGQDLHLKGPRSSLTVQYCGGTNNRLLSTKVAFEISGIGEYNDKYILTDVQTMKGLSLPYQTTDIYILQN